MDEYKSALAGESTGYCVTKIEFVQLNGIQKNRKCPDLICSMISFIK
jgi:hypothetical protein